MIILTGYASRPLLKSSTERVVKKIEGVQGLVNQIEVLRSHATTIAFEPAFTRGFMAMHRCKNTPRIISGITNDPPTGYHAI